MASTGDLITRTYGGFRGVDFRGEEINLVRSPDSLNVWKDYKETDSIRTRPGLGQFASFDIGEMPSSFKKTIYGIFFYFNEMIVHFGAFLYSVNINTGTKTRIYSGMNQAKSSAFAYNNMLYIKDGKNYFMYDGERVKGVSPYVPTTSIGRKPGGGGTIYEDVNLLSPYRINTFLADGESRIYALDAQNIDSDYTPEVTVNDEKVTGFTVNRAKGEITFQTAPGVPLTDGRDNVVIKFKKTVDGYADRINKCTILQVFDNRVFFSGNSDFPNTIWHCSLNDPSYCSDLDYYTEGLDSAAVKALVAGNNALWAFREPSLTNTTVFYHTPTIDSEYGKIYPSTHSSISTGCVGTGINFNDDIVFFSDRGMEGISGDVTTEQVIEHRSSLVDRKMLSESSYKNMILAEWEGYLVVFIGNKAYLADSRSAFTNNDHVEYEWFYWELERYVSFAAVHDGVLYVGSGTGIYTFTDETCDVESYWVTPKDKFNAPQKLKTTNKRGCVAEATGDISLYAKLEDTDFELIGTYEDVTDYFVSRIKRKKFKDIQLKFYSKTRFSLESATLECFVGGYIKR